MDVLVLSGILFGNPFAACICLHLHLGVHVSALFR